MTYIITKLESGWWRIQMGGMYTEVPTWADVLNMLAGREE